MKKIISIAVILFIFSATGCGQENKLLGGDVKTEKPLAFPGAEGFGKYTTGGRGGRVMIVTNLNDDGPGSLRKAATAKEPRIIVFAISGTIHLQSKLNIASNVTIAGQSAPGDGICLADQPVALNGDNIIIRHLRLRMGDRNQNREKVNGAGSDDALSGTKRKNIIIDHCSVSWSTDEALSVYAGDSTTLQWNLIAEPLNYSYHFETGDKDFEQHGFGGIWGGRHFSAHHNLFAHCTSRTPRFDGTRNIQAENADYRNNVIYNWGTNNVYAGEGGNYNIVNNYYKYGPSTKQTVKYRIANPYNKPPDIGFGKFFVSGNFVDGSPEITQNNWMGVTWEKGTARDIATSKLDKPFEAMEVQTHSALKAFELVLKNAGATFPRRDTFDRRIMNDVVNRTGKIIDVQGGYPHGTPYELTTTAWPVLKSAPAPIDSDQDGMPDDWEQSNKLNPADPSDASAFSMSKSFTNIEIYLNELVKTATLKLP